MSHIQTAPHSVRARSKRDPRIDVLRGLALFMIFFDHIPRNWLGYATLHNLALCDAAEVFVLLAGYSAVIAYGRRIDTNGWKDGISRILQRCWQLYLVQIGLVLMTIIVGQAWIRHFNLPNISSVPMVTAPFTQMVNVLALVAQPEYLDIPPLYVVLLVCFR